MLQQLLREGHAWHVAHKGWSDLEFVQRELARVSVPWWIASGWALDLWIGRPQRLHQDFDVLVWREDQTPMLEHLAARGWRLFVPVEGRYRPWQQGEYLELPHAHQVHCYHDDMPFDMLDILLAEREDEEWVWRRNQAVRMPAEQVGTPMPRAGAGGVLNPAIVLLFKSRTGGKQPREKDQADFERILPHLTAEQRAWLRQSLHLHMPDHAWLAMLTQALSL